jgi:hypothetical protein
MSTLKERIAKAEQLSKQPTFSVPTKSHQETFINGAIRQARDSVEVITKLQEIIEIQREALIKIQAFRQNPLGTLLSEDALEKVNQLMNK